MIEINDVRIVSEIAKAGSIHLAAAGLGLTQPALTKRLKAIEERFGFRIFDRLPRGVRLTELGDLFAKQGADLLLHSRDLEETLRRYKAGEQGALKIGIKPCIQSVFCRRSLIAFSSAHPGIQLKIDTREVPVLCDAIREGHLDFGLVGLGYEDEYSADPVLQNSLKFDPLFKIPVSIVLRRNHPVTKGTPTAEDLLRYPVACEPPPSSVRRSMTRRAQDAGIPFEGPQLQVDDYDFILRLVARTDFWTALFSDNDGEIKKRKLFRVLSIPELVPPMVVGLCYRPNWSMPDAAAMLIERLQKNAERYRI